MVKINKECLKNKDYWVNREARHGWMILPTKEKMYEKLFFIRFFLYGYWLIIYLDKVQVQKGLVFFLNMYLCKKILDERNPYSYVYNTQTQLVTHPWMRYPKKNDSNIGILTQTHCYHFDHPIWESLQWTLAFPQEGFYWHQSPFDSCTIQNTNTWNTFQK